METLDQAVSLQLASVPDTRPTISRGDARAAGYKQFFTGGACKHGHVMPRSVSNGRCIRCALIGTQAYFHGNQEKIRASKRLRYGADLEKSRAYQSARRAAHPGKASLDSKLWRIANPTKAATDSAAWRVSNTDRMIAANKAYRAANGEKLRTRQVAFYSANTLKCLNMSRAWCKANAEMVRAIRGNRRARKRNAAGTHNAADILWLMEKQGSKCVHEWCRLSLKKSYDVDHIMPLAKGGGNDRRNLQLVCHPCNLRKHAKHPMDFARLNGMLL